MRKFEKISKDNFFNSVPNGNYEDIILPKRSTKNSAGYDFYSLYDIIYFNTETLGSVLLRETLDSLRKNAK